MEYNLASNNNQWTGKALVMKSFTPNKSGKDWVHAGSLNYSSKSWLIGWQHEYVGTNYSAEAGFDVEDVYVQAFDRYCYE